LARPYAVFGAGGSSSRYGRPRPPSNTTSVERCTSRRPPAAWATFADPVTITSWAVGPSLMYAVWTMASASPIAAARVAASRTSTAVDGGAVTAHPAAVARSTSTVPR
jgi:hypothetical protein